MRFKINQIADEGLVVDVPVTAEWLAAACPDLDARPAPGGLALRGRLTKSGGDYLLRGDLRGELETVCARCLEPARVAIEAPVTVTFVQRDDDELDVDDEDPDVVSFAGNELDLGDDVRDEVLLAMPVGPLCRPDCQGLCPVCGGNRNQVRCDCEERQRQSGSKLAALGRLKV
jgi:uncharacterized metal-binding protein YceD (DUF177 family)